VRWMSRDVSSCGSQAVRLNRNTPYKHNKQRDKT
jgi:hypothetical protein